jgi:hypothetical protein
MKKIKLIWIAIAAVMSATAFAQNKIDEERMQRDIEVAENILGTLIKQQFGKRAFFPMEVNGNYVSGYGVTFRVPTEAFGFIGAFSSDSWDANPLIVGHPFDNNELVYSTSPRATSATVIAGKKGEDAKLKNKKVNADSSKISINDKILAAAKNFIADYGDLITQLGPNEKIVVTNKGQSFERVWINGFGGDNFKRSYLSIEGTKGDVNQFRQGKITRDQLLNRIKVVNSEINNELQPDLETLSSIFSRLYSRDLSKTFFTDENLYYDRLKDYGVIYHMQVYSSSQLDNDMFALPTVRLNEVDQATRDKKVKELYPAFEKSIKEDILEYGRTLRSLSDNEVLTFDVNLTRCPRCGIPSTLELSIKNSVLKDYSTGKISKETALSKIEIKKGAEQ